MAVEMAVEMEAVMGAEDAREKERSCSATNAAGILMAWLPGALIAGTFPAVILRRML
jgi:hypothetical protein